MPGERTDPDAKHGRKPPESHRPNPKCVDRDHKFRFEIAERTGALVKSPQKLALGRCHT